jgi:hypothetical protein
MTTLRETPLNKLVPSTANVRKTGASTGVEERAASIAAHGHLQHLSVRPMLDGENAETGSSRSWPAHAGSRRWRNRRRCRRPAIAHVPTVGSGLSSNVSPMALMTPPPRRRAVSMTDRTLAQSRRTPSGSKTIGDFAEDDARSQGLRGPEISQLSGPFQCPDSG